MGLWNNIKNILTIPEEDEYEDEEFEEEIKEETEEEIKPVEKKEPRIIKSRNVQNKTTNVQTRNGMQVVLVKPDRYDGITSVADHLNEGKTVVVNLEDCDAPNSRRIVDFLSGVTYANGGTMNKVAKNTFIFVCRGVDILGEQVFDDFDSNNLYF